MKSRNIFFLISFHGKYKKITNKFTQVISFKQNPLFLCFPPISIQANHKCWLTFFMTIFSIMFFCSLFIFIIYLCMKHCIIKYTSQCSSTYKQKKTKHPNLKLFLLCRMVTLTLYSKSNSLNRLRRLISSEMRNLDGRDSRLKWREFLELMRLSSSMRIFCS